MYEAIVRGPVTAHHLRRFDRKRSVGHEPVVFPHAETDQLRPRSRQFIHHPLVHLQTSEPVLGQGPTVALENDLAAAPVLRRKRTPVGDEQVEQLGVFGHDVEGLPVETDVDRAAVQNPRSATHGATAFDGAAEPNSRRQRRVVKHHLKQDRAVHEGNDHRNAEDVEAADVALQPVRVEAPQIRVRRYLDDYLRPQHRNKRIGIYVFIVPVFLRYYDFMS